MGKRFGDFKYSIPQRIILYCYCLRLKVNSVTAITFGDTGYIWWIGIVIIIIVMRLDFSKKKNSLSCFFGWVFASDTMVPLIRRTWFRISFGWPCLDYIILNFACDSRQQFVFHSSCFFRSFPYLCNTKPNNNFYLMKFVCDLISFPHHSFVVHNLILRQLEVDKYTPSLTISNQPYDTDSIFIYSWNRKATRSIR